VKNLFYLFDFEVDLACWQQPRLIAAPNNNNNNNNNNYFYHSTD